MELKKICFVHVFPKRLQSDDGGEFKKHERKFCTINKVKMVQCQPYHPQTPGEVKSSRRILCQKIHYDRTKKKKTWNYLGKATTQLC